MVMYRVVLRGAWLEKSQQAVGDSWLTASNIICLTDDKPPSERQIVSALKGAGYVKRNVRYSSIAIVDAGDTLCVEDARTGEPLLNLELVK